MVQISSSFLSVLFLLCILDVSSPTHLDVGPCFRITSSLKCLVSCFPSAWLHVKTRNHQQKGSQQLCIQASVGKKSDDTKKDRIRTELLQQYRTSRGLDT